MQSSGGTGVSLLPTASHSSPSRRWQTSVLRNHTKEVSDLETPGRVDRKGGVKTRELSENLHSEMLSQSALSCSAPSHQQPDGFSYHYQAAWWTVLLWRIHRPRENAPQNKNVRKKPACRLITFQGGPTSHKPLRQEFPSSSLAPILNREDVSVLTHWSGF